MNNCECNKKTTVRSEETKKSFENRLNRIIGQLGGIKKMIDEDRYCGDILIQLSAAESAMENLGYAILEDHMASCVSREIKLGNKEIIGETVELMKKLK